VEISVVTRAQMEVLERQEDRYRGGRLPLNVQGQTVILVDDGIATGSSLWAAIQAIRKMRPAAMIVAIPVAPGNVRSPPTRCGRTGLRGDAGVI